MKIKNTKVAFLNESIYRAKYPFSTTEPDELYLPNGDFDVSLVNEKDETRSINLANVSTGSGHDNFLKGIIVQFDLCYPQYFSQHLQRYNWINIVSSQSKMHKVTAIKNLKQHCNEYVLDSIIDEVAKLIELYNTAEFPYCLNPGEANEKNIENKEECFQYIISNLPMGYELWMGITTNYLQLKTIYKQRRNHKLKSDWGYFCNWIETLPKSNLITNKHE